MWPPGRSFWDASLPAGGPSPYFDGETLLAHWGPSTIEAMRLLPKGAHSLALRGRGRAGFERVVVRAIPELVFSKFGAHPHVHEYGKYDWAFLSKHVLPSLNVLVCTGADAQKPFLKGWRCLVECSVPGLRAKEAVTADEAEKHWSGHLGMTDPVLGGIIVDEFWGGMSVSWDW